LIAKYYSYNIICFVLEGCWKSLLLFAGIIVGVIVFLLCCCYCVFSGNCFKLMKCCCQVAKTGAKMQGDLIDTSTKQLQKRAFSKEKYSSDSSESDYSSDSE